MADLLKKTFYTVNELSATDNSIKASITLNADHDVYKGHFPQMPVVPGVCQMQIIKELLEQTTTTKTIMVSGDNIKFTGMILPDKHPTVHVEINYSKNETGFVVDAKLFFQETIFTKQKSKYQIIN